MEGTLKTQSRVLSEREDTMTYLHKDARLFDFIDEWLTTIKRPEIKPSTYGRLQTCLNALSGYSISDKLVGDITSKDFSIYIQDLMNNKLRLTTIKKQMQIISAPMRYAYLQRIIPFNPCEGVKPPSESNVLTPTKEIVAYTPEEQERLKAVLGTHERNGFIIAEFIMETGLRIGEVVALKWDDVQIERRRMRIHATAIIPYDQSIKPYVQEGAKASRAIGLCH